MFFLEGLVEVAQVFEVVLLGDMDLPLDLLDGSAEIGHAGVDPIEVDLTRVEDGEAPARFFHLQRGGQPLADEPPKFKTFRPSVNDLKLLHLLREAFA